MHPLRKTILSTVVEAMHYETASAHGDEDGWLRAVSAMDDWREDAEEMTDQILKSVEANGQKLDKRVWQRFRPAFPLSRSDCDALKDFAHMLRSTLAAMESHKILIAGRVIGALEELPFATPDLHVQVSLSEPMMPGGHGYASLELTPEHIELDFGESVYGDFGGDHASQVLFDVRVDSTYAKGSAWEWLERIRSGPYLDDVSFTNMAE